MSGLEVPVFSSIGNSLMNSRYFTIEFVSVIRPYAFMLQSTLRGNKAGSRATPLFALAISARVVEFAKNGVD